MKYFKVKKTATNGHSLIEWDFYKELPHRSLQVETEIANLWAASPDLLKACKTACRSLESLADNVRGEEWIDIIELKKAIAKAEGKI